MMDASDVMFLQDSIVWKIDEAPASMERVNRRPSVGNFIHIIEDCRKIRNLAHAKRVHMEIRDNGLEAHILLGSPLIQLYVECGSLPDAQQVFDSLVEHNEHSWTSLIHGYVETGKFQHALSLFNKMQEDHVDANRQTFLTLMKACSRLNWLDRGREIHSEIAKEGFEIDPTIGNTLVDMYGKCNSVAEAREVFNDLTDRGLVSWNALISGYADNGLGEEALNCVDRMQLEGIVPDAITLLCGLKACASIGALERGLELHAMVAKEGFESHSFLSCTLVDMYAKCGQLADAREVFDELPTRSVVSWTVLIAGYAEHGHGEEALSCLAELQREGLSPNVITFVCSLKACGSIRAIDKGRELHAEIAKEGFESHPFLNSTLVDMYAKCGSLAESREVFNELPNQDLVSWTALIAGYAEHGHDEEALNSLEAMRRDGVSPNVVTLVCSLKACGNIGAIDRGRKLHIEIVIEGLETNSFAINALVGMYAKCGSLGEAWDVFEELPGRDVISWNAMILGYAEQGESEKAFTLSAQMQEQGLLPDSTTFVSMLKAISNTEALETGKKIHAQVFRSSGLEATEVIFATAFIDMYSKCGSMANAQQVFDTIQTKDLILWTALITGYTQQGESNRVFHLFDTMTKAGVQPNSITFLSLLNVCSHSGLVDRAQKYIEVMSKEYGITPTIKHHNCMVDLLGRAGQFLQAVAVLEKMPTQPSYVTWSTVLGHCRNQDNVELAKHALESALRVDDKHHAMFDLMSNISADLFMEEYEDDDVL